MFRKKQRSKYFAMGIILVLIFSLTLTGCASPATPSPPPAAPAAPAAPGAAPEAAELEPVHLSMFIWAGANQGVVPKEIVEAFLLENPHVTIEFHETNNATIYPMMVAAREATPDDPLVNMGFFNQATISRGEFDGMWISLDPEVIPNMHLIDEGFWRPGNRGIGFVDTPSGLLYNVNAAPRSPTSWADLWSDDFAGRVTLWDYNWFAPVMAARINGGSEFDMEPGWALWEERAGNLHSLFTSNDQMKNLLISGDAWIAPFFSSLSTVWIEDEGAPLGWVAPQEGAIAHAAYLAIVEGSSPAQIAVAKELINILLEPEWNARYAELTNNVPLARGAMELLPPGHFDRPGLTGDFDMIHFDWDYMAQHDSDWRSIWDRRIKANM